MDFEASRKRPDNNIVKTRRRDREGEIKKNNRYAMRCNVERDAELTLPAVGWQDTYKRYIKETVMRVW